MTYTEWPDHRRILVRRWLRCRSPDGEGHRCQLRRGHEPVVSEPFGDDYTVEFGMHCWHRTTLRGSETVQW